MMPSRKESTAVLRPEDLAGRGFYLFPCQGKRPLVKWTKYSTTNVSVLESWEIVYPGCSWGVDCGKSGFFVLDDDRGKNPEAMNSLEALEIMYGALPATFTVQTPSGGYHFYYRGTGRNSASSKLGKGLDSRSAGGYVIAPCSPGYIVTTDAPIIDAPQWLIDLTGRPMERDPQEAPASIVLDMPFSINRAIDYLSSADPAIEGDGGDAYTYRVACRIRDLGISQDKCLELMLEYWDERNSPPWGEALSEKVFNAYRYAENPLGADAPEVVFTAFTDIPPETKSSLFTEANALLSREIKIDYLIHDLIEMPTTGLIFGDPSSGKSFLAIWMALAVACGTDWMGAMAKPGVAVYFAGEGRQGIQRRMAAWRKYHNIVIPENRLWVSDKRIEFTPKAMREVSDELKRIEDIHGLPILCSTVDTLARHIQRDGDENSARDMGGFINVCDALRDKFGMAMVVVHHSGKMNKDTSRGSSAIRGAMDWEIKIENKGGARSLIFTKQKEGELPAPMGFTLKQVEIAPGVISAVPLLCKYDPTGGKIPNLSANATLYLELLRMETSEKGKKEVLKADVDKSFKNALGGEMSRQSKSNVLTRAVNALYTGGLISYDGTRIALIEDGNED